MVLRFAVAFQQGGVVHIVDDADLHELRDERLALVRERGADFRPAEQSQAWSRPRKRVPEKKSAVYFSTSKKSE